MKKVLDCLKDDMLTLMKDGRAGVVLRLVKAALRFTDIQDDIITVRSKVLPSPDSMGLVLRCIVTLIVS